MNIKKQNLIILLLITVVVLFVLFGTSVYSDSIEKRLSASTKTTLNEAANQQQHAYNNDLHSEMIRLGSIANTLDVFEASSASLQAYLSSLSSRHDFETLIYATADGGMTSEGRYIDMHLSDIFNESMQGKSRISLTMISQYTGEMVLTFSVPVYDGSDVVAVLAAEYPLQFLNDIFTPAFNGMGYGFVFDSSGEIIGFSRNDYTLASDNLFVGLSTATFNDGTTLEELKASLSARESGTLAYTMNGEDRLAEYRPLDFSDWSILVAIPTSVIYEHTNIINEQMASFNNFILITVFILAITIILIQQLTTKKIQKLAYYDELTGIPNLLKFKHEIYKILKNNREKDFAIMKLDISNFKSINEIFDFETGNDIIRAIADVGREVNAPHFVQARVGTDEFLIFTIADRLAGLEEEHFLREKIFLSKVPVLENYNVVFRYGRYFIERGEIDVNVVVDRVTLAHSLLRNKNDRAIYDYDDKIRENVVKTSEITNKMESAMANREFKVFLQPKYKLNDSSIDGAEALVRWIEADGKMIYPNDFIPIFEQNGFILKLDIYMLERVCEIIRDWMDKGITPVPVSVNFSRVHLNNPNFTDQIKDITRKYNVPEGYIEVELTESAILDNEEVLLNVLKELHDSGFTLSMDDFGTGYSSLGLLKNLEVDVIKMDRSFFISEKDEERAKVVIESVIDMAHSLGIKTVAEGVETKEQMEFLRSLDCEVAQGYFYAKPMPVQEFNKQMKKSEGC